MGPSKVPPLSDYAIKLMLLEAIKCYHEQNKDAIAWLETQMFKMVSRWEELNRDGK